MPEPQTAPNTRAPWHLWVVGVFALLWSAMGARDYLLTLTKNAAYTSAFTAEQLAFFYSFPAWVVSAWAISVWGGVLGALLLLARRRLAAWVFLASLLGIAVTTFRNYALADGRAIFGGAVSVAFTAVIFLLVLGFFFYARAMSRRGVLV